MTLRTDAIRSVQSWSKETLLQKVIWNPDPNKRYTRYWVDRAETYGPGWFIWAEVQNDTQYDPPARLAHMIGRPNVKPQSYKGWENGRLTRRGWKTRTAANEMLVMLKKCGLTDGILIL